MNDWDLLSPRYFSDIFVSLFNGGPLVFMAIFFLLFFGSLILPMIVQTWRKWGGAGNPTSSRRRFLPIQEAPPFIHEDERRDKIHWSHAIFYFLSFGLSALYIIFHVVISSRPAAALTVGGQLQWLAADDVRALVQFLYRWVLTGYALTVLSVTLGLDYLARWMQKAWPKPPEIILLEEEPPPPSVSPVITLPPPTITPPLETVIDAVGHPTFLILTEHEKKNRRQSGEEKLIYDYKRPVCVSVDIQIEYEDKWSIGEDMQRALRFRVENGIWYAASPARDTSVFYAIGGKWFLLVDDLPLNDKLIRFKWTKDDIRYYCNCERYVKL